MQFEWDADKNALNVAKHGIDFVRDIEVFRGEVIIMSSDRGGEPRWLAVGMVGGRETTVIYTLRSGVYRIISARRARWHEREDYNQALRRGGSGGSE